MWYALLLAVIAALMVAVLSLLFRRPRTVMRAWVSQMILKIRYRLYLQHREDTQRAIERIAAELAQRRCSQEGNPDDEFYSDWCRWFSGDPDANVDYSRKQQRDLKRLGKNDSDI